MRRLWSFYRSGATVEQLMRRFPQLSAAKIFDSLAFALDNEEVLEADVAREQEMLKRANRRGPARPKGAAQQMALPFAGDRRR